MLAAEYDFDSIADRTASDPAEVFRDPFNEDEVAVEKSGITEHQRSRAAPKTIDKTADSILASELNKLTFKERETINEEIHGVGAVVNIEETPERLTESFRRLQRELEKLCSTVGGVGETAHVFKQSQEMFGSNPEDSILNTEEYRSMFLLCDNYDCKKAAVHLCQFAELMYDLYGDVALERKIKLSDMTEKEVAIMKLGHCQHLWVRDRAGRRIYIHFLSETWDDFPIKTRQRILTFYFLSVLSNEDCHKRGMVILFWAHDMMIKVDQFITRGIISSRLSKSLPLRVGAVHYLFSYEDIIERKGSLAMANIVSRLAKRFKLHIRMHWGSPVECLYILESFGIPSRHIPIDLSNGKIKLENNNRWIQMCAAKDQNSKLSKQVIDCPNHSDILFGRGQIVMDHPGNVMFRNYIQSKLDLYSSISSKKASTQWTWGVVRTFQNEYGARFLKEERIGTDHMAWVEVSNESARSKVRIAFRDAKSRLSKSAKQQNNSSKRNGTSEIKMDREDIIQMPKQSSSPSKGMNFVETKPDDPISFSMSSRILNQIDGKSSLPQQQVNTIGVNLVNINNNLRQLNDDLRQLSNNLSASTSQHSVDSSTLLFLNSNNYSTENQCCSFNSFDFW